MPTHTWSDAAKTSPLNLIGNVCVCGGGQHQETPKGGKVKLGDLSVQISVLALHDCISLDL